MYTYQFLVSSFGWKYDQKLTPFTTQIFGFTGSQYWVSGKVRKTVFFMKIDPAPFSDFDAAEGGKIIKDFDIIIWIQLITHF